MEISCCRKFLFPTLTSHRCIPAACHSSPDFRTRLVFLVTKRFFFFFITMTTSACMRQNRACLMNVRLSVRSCPTGSRCRQVVYWAENVQISGPGLKAPEFLFEIFTRWNPAVDTMTVYLSEVFVIVSGRLFRHNPQYARWCFSTVLTLGTADEEMIKI